MLSALSGTETAGGIDMCFIAANNADETVHEKEKDREW